MDSSGYRIEFLGNSCGQHGSYTFYRGVRYWKDDKCHSLSLGEFFHGRMSSNDQVIPLIGELQLLWEEKHHEGLKLSSVRLYILPENCPGGRLPHHGQDEILAEDDKVVLRVEDLMKLVVLEPVVWTNGLLALHKFCPQDILTGSNGLKANSFMLCQSACQGNSNNRASNNNGTRVVILSYSRYCRYRAALKRFEGCTNRWLADFLMSAIGGFSTCSIETRVMFCRNTVEHPVLESYECRMNHLAPSLKGRRRKQRPKSKPNESEDSNESETNSEKNSLRCKKTSEGPLEKRKPIGKLSEGGKLSELNNRANPKCKKTAVNNEKGFLKRLHKYMNDRGRPIVRIPTLGFKEVNLYQFYQCTQQLGGYNEVTEKRLWKHVYDQLGGSPGNTSAATGTRKNYEKLLLDYEQHCRNRKKRSVSTDVEMKKFAASSAKDSTESSSVSQTDSSEATTAAGDGNSCNSSSVSSQDAGKTHGTGSQSIDGSGDASQQQQQQKLVGSDGPPKQQPSGTQSKNAVKLKKQKKLLRKKSLQGYTDSVPVNDAKKLSLSTAKQNPESMKSKQEPPVKDAATEATDLLQSPSTKSDNSQGQAEDQKHLVSVSSLKAIEAATIVPCKVAMTMLKTKSSEVLENCTKKGVPNGRVLPVKVEQPESMEGEARDSNLTNYLCGATTVLPVTASAVDDVNFEEKKFVPCVGVIALPQKSKSSAGSEIGAKDSCAKTTSTIRTSSVSRKLLSGGHAVVESGTVDKDQSKHLLSEKTETCSMKLSSNMLPIRQVVEELLASKSLGIPHPFNGGAMASRYSLGGVAPLMPSSPGLPPSGLSSLEAALSSEPNKKEARLCVKKESSIRPSSAIQFSVDNINARDAVFEFVEDKCHSGVPTPQPMTSSSICPAQSKQQSALKRSQPFSLPSESHVDAKKQRTEQERPASNQFVERPPTCHQTSVISSPIKRFIDRTKNWVPPPPPLPPPLNPTAQIATSQSSSWTSDDQPTDLSMKTLMSRQQQQQQQSNCLSSLVLPQDEPLDLSKTSSLFPRSVKNEASARPPVVLPGSVAAQAFQRNGLNLTTSTNKVAFVAPSLRSTSSFLPPTSYQMSHFQSMNNISSMQQPLKPEQLAPLVAYAPFHPAFQILSTPILSALAGSGSLLCSSSSPSAVSPRLAVPLYPVIPITQNAAISASDRIPSILEMGNPVSSSIFKRASRKS